MKTGFTMGYVCRKTARLPYLLLFAGMISCSSGPDPQRYELQAKIEQYFEKQEGMAAADSSLNLCELLPASGWDSVYVIAPYTSMKRMRSMELNNFNKIKGEIKTIQTADWECWLLFIKGRDIIYYSKVGRGPLDLAELRPFASADCPVYYAAGH